MNIVKAALLTGARSAPWTTLSAHLLGPGGAGLAAFLTPVIGVVIYGAWQARKED